jgi:2-ketocyclohexanecarboxyl-CoA hydrolase
MSNTEATRYEVRQGAAWITLNRPDNRNALSAVLVNELADHIAAATPIRRPGIVITGAGRHSGRRGLRTAGQRTGHKASDWISCRR